MPIYEYRCSSCGAHHEVLQRLSDPLLVTCPSCHKEALVKQVSAAGFQLKGSGWYATDFRNGSKPPAKGDGKTGDAKSDADKPAPAADAKSDGAGTKPAETKSGSTTEAAKPAPAASKPSSSE
ncbi:MAG TPA: zinc ribbon domain-containing protein [Casimicrobiaceae bacterium]|nr:zinc ribbon domain-containing protein [Casimicrobiaceae bacterium]